MKHGSKHARHRLFAFLLAVAATAFANLALANADPSAICDQASEVISRETGVPLDVLRAITLTETGRTRGGTTRPWPWTVNMEGKGVWFETEDDARAYVFEHFKRGARSFDVGCYQLNYKWHHQGFSSIDEMFDPLASGRYAANFLSRLYEEKGNWKEAAGAYHSRTPKYAERYMATFSEFRATLATIGTEAPRTEIAAFDRPADDTATQIAQPVTRRRVNTFPLLQGGAGATVAPGSLVPLNRGTANKGLIDFNGTG